MKKIEYFLKSILLIIILISNNSIAFSHINELKYEQENYLNLIESDSLRITGTIKNNLSKPLSGVKIEYNGQIYYSDSLGNFEIGLKNKKNNNGLLVFDKLGFIKETRNYNFEMKNTNYDITLSEYIYRENPNFNYRAMSCGLPIRNQIISFKRNNSTLEDSIKIILKQIGSVMRSNPSFPLNIQGFYFENIKRTEKRYQVILDYMSTVEKIDKERFILKEPIKLNANFGEEERIIFNR
jgi:hypothetical protein